MRLTGSRAYIRPAPVPKMPPGLVELMEDLTRDVLKNNPSDVYEFCAEHMRKLLEIRDGPSLKKPLTLEQKITRAQEKVRKHGDERWQNYLKEKGKAISQSKTKLDLEKPMTDETVMKQPSPTIQASLKPPVYPDLNIEKANELEISHEPGHVPNLPVDMVKNIDANNKEMDQNDDNSENKELTVNISKSIDNTNATLNVTHDAVPNAKENEIIDEVNAIKTEAEQHQSAFSTTEQANCEEKENNEVTSDPPNKDKESKAEMLVQETSEIQTAKTQETTSDSKNHNKELEQEKERLINSTITDMGKIVSTAVGIHNVMSEYSRSPSRNDNNSEGIIIPKDCEHEDYSLKGVEQSEKPSSFNDNESLSNIITNKNAIDEIEETHSSTMKRINDDNIPDEGQQYNAAVNVSNHAPNTQLNKSELENNYEQSNITVLPVKEDSETKSDYLKNSELDNSSQKIAEETVSTNMTNIAEPPIIHINYVINDNSEQRQVENVSNSDSSGVGESSKAPMDVESVDDLDASNAIQDHGEEPSDNVLDIHETTNTQEPNDAQIIEIRISQVAEALNNEEPLINEENGNDEMVKDTDFSLVPDSKYKTAEQFLNVLQNENDKREEKEAHLFQGSENVDDNPSTITLVDNTDDSPNVKTSDTIRSISMDESTDGLDNTSLVESGTSEASDDVIQKGPNNNSMDLETAAVTIQKVFRSFLFKSRASTFEDNEDNISLDEDNEKKDELDFQVSNANLNKERRGISRMDTVLQTVNEEKSLSLSTDDSSTLSSAATTIQAHVRGFLVRNKLHSHKTTSSNSLVNSDGPIASLDEDVDHKNKTILNIHIVPEGGNYLSRDESMLTSTELSLDGSPPSSLNLHPLGYDKNERRKLKREDAIQSISPPSNNSGKLSEDVDSVKDMLITEGENQTKQQDIKDDAKGELILNRPGSGDTSPTNSLTIETVIEAHKADQESSDAEPETPIKTKRILTKQSSDEMDVVTPFEDKNSWTDSRSTSKLLHSGEFHDIVLPTKVSRSDASVVSEFKNVLVYFLLWNNS